MVENKFISKEQIKIKVVLNNHSSKEFFNEIFEYISTYLNLSVIYIDNLDNKKEIIDPKEKIDYFFVDFVKEYEYIFAWNFYSKMHEINNNFKLILFKENIETDDIRYFKNGADDIIYINPKYYEDHKKYLTWKIFSILRRKWDYSHKTNILIHKGVIIDLVKRKVIINNKEIKVTSKEFEVLYILVEEFYNKNSFTTKNKIFKKIYGINNENKSRVVDQLIFRLKRKFPEDFFAFDKKKSIKIL